MEERRVKRPIKQIALIGENDTRYGAVVALCEDGTLWRLGDGGMRMKDASWIPLPPILEPVVDHGGTTEDDDLGDLTEPAEDKVEKSDTGERISRRLFLRKRLREILAELERAKKEEEGTA